MVWGYREPAPISVGPKRAWKYIFKTLSSPAINKESRLRITKQERQDLTFILS